MSQLFEELEDILNRTKDECIEFMDVLTPRVEKAEDEHERLYWHHIYEEEEQRLDRLNDLLPKLTYFIENDDDQETNNLEFVHLLQDLSLEKFGLHNFEEHLDLGLYWFKDSDQGPRVQELRDSASNDYQKIKELLHELNQKFDGAASRAGSEPTDEKENISEDLKLTKYKSTSEESGEHSTKPYKKGLTVGSLRRSF